MKRLLSGHLSFACSYARFRAAHVSRAPQIHARVRTMQLRPSIIIRSSEEDTLTPLLILPWKKEEETYSIDRSPLGRGLPSRSLGDSSHGSMRHAGHARRRLHRTSPAAHLASLSFKRKPCPSTTRNHGSIGFARYSSDGRSRKPKKRDKILTRSCAVRSAGLCLETTTLWLAFFLEKRASARSVCRWILPTYALLGV